MRLTYFRFSFNPKSKIVRLSAHDEREQRSAEKSKIQNRLGQEPEYKKGMLRLRVARSRSASSLRLQTVEIAVNLD